MSFACIVDWLAYAVLSLVVIHLVNIFIAKGLGAVLKEIASFLLLIPATDRVVKFFTRKEISSFMKDAFDSDKSAKNSREKVIAIPEKGDDDEDLRKQLVELKSGHKDLSSRGRLFAYVYTSEGSHFELQKEAFAMFTSLTHEDAESTKHNELVMAYLDTFMHDNALNPLIFPALRKFENEVVAMTAWMLHGDGDVVGSVTSGGTESCLMAMKTHRDRARSLRPKITKPNVVAPDTIHPAFAKACHYFDVELKLVPVSTKTFVVNLKEYEDAINNDTILLLASAPSYPQAILDPVKEISAIAISMNLPLHVDACFGGFMLPWVDRLPGRVIPAWDFRLPGVTSISADLHKYGYATKGASVVCYRDCEIRKHQFFAHVGWPGGLFVSPTMAGTRPGGHLAAAWVALRSMGVSGYMEMAKKLMEIADKMKSTINNMQGLKVLGNPLMTAFSFTSVDDKINIFGLVDVMETKEVNIKVSSVSKACSNFNCHLQWEAPSGFKCSKHGDDEAKDEKDRLTYTVKFEDWSTNDMKLIPLEDCIETSRCRCRIPDVVKVNSIEAQYYWIVSNYKNKTQHVEDEIVPYMTVVLQPPKFEVSIDITRTVLIKIKERQAARKGSKITLVDALYVHHHYPNYVVKYWSQGNDTRLVKKFDADNSTSISFPLEDVKPNENVCFCMSLEATIYDSKDCSSPGVCLKVPASGDFGRILTMCGYVLVFILILVSIAAAYKVTRRFQNKVQVFKQNSIPTSLMNTIREEKKTKNADEKFIQYSPFDKNVELYDLSEVNVKPSSRDVSHQENPTSYYSEQKESSGSSQSSEEESGSSGGTLTEELTVSDAPQKDQFNVESGSGVFTGYIQIPLMGNDPPMSL